MHFKQYLNEAWMVSELMAQGGVPLSIGMMDRLGYSEPDKIAYHLTNSRSLKEKYKLQNKEFHISCFTKGSVELSKLPSKPDLLLKVKGHSLIEADVDIFTEPSTKKRRWITSNGTKLQKHMQGILFSSLRENGIVIDDLDISDINNRKKITKILNNKNPKQIFRTYLKKTEKWINSGGYKVLNDFLKTASDFKYNEVILTRWEILEVSDIRYQNPEVVKFCTEKNLNYGGIIDWKDISDINI